MSSDPFAEPSDGEHTVFRPRPSGTGEREVRAEPPPPRGQPVRPVPKVGTNPLVAAASPVLAAVVRVASSRGPAPDTDRLRDSMIKGIRAFESEALATGLDTRSLRAARYALCATIDDMVLSTPWGSASSWAQQSITGAFHNELIGGDRFFDILEQMQQDLGRHSPVVELMYLCTSLGFEGRYRVMPRGVAALTELRDGVYRTIRQRRGDFERELSPHWRGLVARARALANRIPLWVLALGTLVIALCMYVGFTFLLASSSDLAFAELFALPPRQALPVPRARPPAPAPAPATPAPSTPAAAAAAAVPPPPPPPASLTVKLRQFLAPEIRDGLVVVFEDAQTVTVRLTNRNMFASGQATLGPIYPPLLARIGSALQDEPGQVSVNGYTDNEQPSRTARFPSNYELSLARAETVAAALRAKLTDPRRVRAEGKSDSNAIGNNATPEGRQQNRRTEIVLIRPSDAM